MSKALTEQQAKAVWRILVAECGASPNPDDELSFVMEYTADSAYSPSSEWRFGGCLGFGGKFRYPGLRVDCYPEDETPERNAAVLAANARLAVLRREFASQS